MSVPMAGVWNRWSLKRFSNPKYSKPWHSPHPVQQPFPALPQERSVAMEAWPWDPEQNEAKGLFFTKFLLDRCRNTLRSLNKFTWSFPVELLADVPQLCRLPCRSPTNTTKTGKCRNSVAAVSASASAITTTGCCVLSYIFCPETLSLSSVL